MRTETTHFHPASLLRLLKSPERNLNATIDELIHLVDAVMTSADSASENRAG